jgi:predicted DNA-binding protein (MmcQ/YjbR family)
VAIFPPAAILITLLLMNADIDWVRELCLSFSHATEQVTWGADLTFRISGKIFAVTVLEPAKVWLSFKCSAEDFAELTERAGILPAPYLARAQWVALENKDALAKQELATLLRESYELVLARLPKKTREALLQPSRSGRKRKTAARKRS